MGVAAAVPTPLPAHTAMDFDSHNDVTRLILP